MQNGVMAKINRWFKIKLQQPAHIELQSADAFARPCASFVVPRSTKDALAGWSIFFHSGNILECSKIWCSSSSSGLHAWAVYVRERADVCVCKFCTNLRLPISSAGVVFRCRWSSNILHRACSSPKVYGGKIF